MADVDASLQKERDRRMSSGDQDAAQAFYPDSSPTQLRSSLDLRMQVPGCVFTGWNTRPDGSGESYADRATAALSSDVKLYAQWRVEAQPLLLDKLGCVEMSGNANAVSSLGTDRSGLATPNDIVFSDGFKLQFKYRQPAPVKLEQTVVRSGMVEMDSMRGFFAVTVSPDGVYAQFGSDSRVRIGDWSSGQWHVFTVERVSKKLSVTAAREDGAEISAIESMRSGRFNSSKLFFGYPWKKYGTEHYAFPKLSFDSENTALNGGGAYLLEYEYTARGDYMFSPGCMGGQYDFGGEGSSLGLSLDGKTWRLTV